MYKTIYSLSVMHTMSSRVRKFNDITVYMRLQTYSRISTISRSASISIRCIFPSSFSSTTHVAIEPIGEFPHQPCRDHVNVIFRRVT